MKKQNPDSLLIHRKKTLYFRVGIDFGTSSTKIAYFQIGGRGKVHPILFNHKLSHYPAYCLPSVVAFDNSKKLLLGIEASRYLADKPWNTGLRRLKVAIAGKYDKNFYDKETVKACKDYLSKTLGEYPDIEPEYLTAIFLAYTMRQARLTIQRKFPDDTLDIAFNICIPIDHIQHNKVNSVFKKIIAVAEKIESQWCDGNNWDKILENVGEIYLNSKYLPDNQNTRAFLVPEAVAETASYLVSLGARDGLHAVIDFGAGTTDISIFNLHGVRSQDSATSWYSARNIPRGAQRIERIVMEFLLKNKRKKYVSEPEVLKAIKNLKNSHKHIMQEIGAELEGLWKDTHCAWREAYGHFKNQSEWERDKVQVFLCGGGSNVPYIHEIFKQSWMKDWGPYPIMKLPIPDNYDSMGEKAPFERLSVAYGLTIPLPELGKFTLPLDSPNHTPPKLPVREIRWWNERLPTEDWLGRR